MTLNAFGLVTEANIPAYVPFDSTYGADIRELLPTQVSSNNLLIHYPQHPRRHPWV